LRVRSEVRFAAAGSGARGFSAIRGGPPFRFLREPFGQLAERTRGLSKDFVLLFELLQTIPTLIERLWLGFGHASFSVPPSLGLSKSKATAADEQWA
jgi:hypothetical protein